MSENVRELVEAAKMLLCKLRTGNYEKIGEAYVRVEEAVKVLEAQEYENPPLPIEAYEVLVWVEDM